MAAPFTASYVCGATSSSPWLFWETVTPSSLSVILLLEVTELPYVSYKAKEGSRAHLSDPRFLKLSPDRSLPLLKHGDLVLTTPNAILRYLCQEFRVDETWYARARKPRATVNSALDWSAFTLRRAVQDFANSLTLDRAQLVDEYWGTNTGSGGAHTNKPNGLVSAMARVEAMWVPRGAYVLAKTPQPSIADVVLFLDFQATLHSCNMSAIITPALYPKLFMWSDAMSKFLASELLDDFLVAQKKIGLSRPQPPPRPEGLSLPWLDYRITTA